MQMLVNIPDWVVRVWFGVVHELVIKKLDGNSFINRYLRDIFLSLGILTLRKSRLVFISAFGREDEKSRSPIVTNDVCTETEIRVRTRSALRERN